MYYFILEPPKNNTEKVFLERLKELSRQFGIASEISQSSPARSASELAQRAIMKNYSTIVAVGSENHINKVVREIMKNKPNQHIALGIVCTEPASMLSEKWGFKRPEDACDTLKYRKLSRFDIGFIEPDIYFLTSVHLEPRNPIKLTMEVDNWKAESIITRAEISSNLYILLERHIKEKSLLHSTINVLSGRKNERYEHSIFKGRIISLDTIPPIPVYVGTEKIAKTPLTIYRKLSGLNIITKRDRVLSES